MYPLQVQCMLQMQVQVTMLIKPVNPLKLLVLQEHTRLTQVKHPVMMLMQVTMLIKPVNPLQLLARQELIIQPQVQQVPQIALNPLWDTTFQHLDSPIKLLVLREPTSLILDKQTVMMRVQGTMFHLQDNRARLLVQ